MRVDFLPFYLSLKLSLLVTAILLVTAFPLAYYLTFRRVRGKVFWESLLMLPAVMPPTVLGFYLLLAFSRGSVIGKFFESVFGAQLVFSFPGIVIASCIYSLPFALQPIKAGLEGLDRALIEASYTLGKTKWQTLRSVILPNIRPALVTAGAMSFAHTMGEFGTVLMIGGSIPGVTRVASIAIYDKVEQLDYLPAHVYSILLLLLSFLVLLTVNHFHKRTQLARV